MKSILSMIATIFFSATVCFANALVVKKGDVKFTAVGKPGFLKIRGESKGQFPKGEIKIEKDSVTGEFNFDLKNLDTGIDLRNEHMKDKYLEVAKFPSAKLILKDFPLKVSEMNSDIKKSFKGSLTLHGVTKDVDGEFTYKAKDKNVIANFEIKVSDFKIDIPKYLGITVSETVQIETTLSVE